MLNNAIQICNAKRTEIVFIVNVVFKYESNRSKDVPKNMPFNLFVAQTTEEKGIVFTEKVMEDPL